MESIKMFMWDTTTAATTIYATTVMNYAFVDFPVGFSSLPGPCNTIDAEVKMKIIVLVCTMIL